MCFGKLLTCKGQRKDETDNRWCVSLPLFCHTEDEIGLPTAPSLSHWGGNASLWHNKGTATNIKYSSNYLNKAHFQRNSHIKIIHKLPNVTTHYWVSHRNNHRWFFHFKKILSLLTINKMWNFVERGTKGFLSLWSAPGTHPQLSFNCWGTPPHSRSDVTLQVKVIPSSWCQLTQHTLAWWTFILQLMFIHFQWVEQLNRSPENKKRRQSDSTWSYFPHLFP